MTRCQHCKKLTHDEHLFVTFEKKDFDKIAELETLEGWKAAFKYQPILPSEWGLLKCGDIYLHFICKIEMGED